MCSGSLAGSPARAGAALRTGGRGVGFELRELGKGLLVRLTLLQEALGAAIAHDGLPFALDGREISAGARPL